MLQTPSFKRKNVTLVSNYFKLKQNYEKKRH